MTQASLAETEHQVPLVSKEREVILVCLDHRDHLCHKRSQKELREKLDYQVWPLKIELIKV